MQNAASVPVDQFSDLLKRLPAGLDLDTLARETKAIQRDRKIGGGANLLRLAVARGLGGFSLCQSSGPQRSRKRTHVCSRKVTQRVRMGLWSVSLRSR